MRQESFSSARTSKDSENTREQDPWSTFFKTYRAFVDSMITPIHDLDCASVNIEIDIAVRQHDKRRLMLALIELRKHLLANGSKKPEGLFSKLQIIKLLAEKSF